MPMSSSLLHTIRTGLVAHHSPKLVDELLQAYAEVKRNYYAGGLRLSAVEGGRFCEAAFRLLQERTTGTSTPLGKQLDTEKLISQLGNLPAAHYPDSIRLHIPRSLRMVYDIRNKRDAAHLADGIDPNKQDATLVASTVDWVLAEFVRLYHAISADEAQELVENLVTRRAPVVQAFGSFLKVLNPALAASDHLLVLLYQRGASGASYEQLCTWSRPAMRGNLKKTLYRLEHDKALIHCDGDLYFITESGLGEVERRKLITSVQFHAP